jgi:four helix bundle protein
MKSMQQKSEMNGSGIRELSFGFALRVVKLCRFLEKEKKENVLSRQLLKSGTAIGALIREAQQAESRADFIHKLSIALKEANETEYWIDLLYQSQLIEKKGYESIKPDIVELLKLLTSIIKSTKNRRDNG